MSLLKCMWQPFVAQLVHFPLLLKTDGSPPCSTFIFPHAGWGVYSSSPPCHCLFCWVWTSNSRLSADDIWLRMWHPWLIHTRLMHRNRYFSVWCIHRSMGECTSSCSVLRSIEIDVHVTVFCALLSCTGLSTNYSCACVGNLHTQLDTECSQQRLYVHLDSHQWKHVWMFSLFLITWSILTSALPTFLQASRPRGSEKYPFKRATASTCKDAEQSALHRQHSLTTEEDDLGVEWNAECPFIKTQQRAAGKEKAVSAVGPYHTPGSSSETTHDFLSKGVPPAPALCM